MLDRGDVADIISQLGLQFTGVGRMEEGQRNIEGFLGIKAENSVPLPEKNGESSRPKRSLSEAISVPDDDASGWTCPKCRKVLPLPDGLAEDELEKGLAGIRQEHEDYHFALALQQGGDEAVQEAPPKKRKKEKDKGIAAFFGPKPKKL
jgi:DNA polymerase eta